MNPAAMLRLLLACCCCLALAKAPAQTPACENFNNGSAGSWQGWQADAGTSSAPPTADGTVYLTGKDHGGASYLYNMDYNAQNIKCGTICFNLDVFEDGVSGTPNVGGVLRIFSGTVGSPTVSATFVLDVPVNQGSGWVKICIPMNQVVDGGTLPSNTIGHWEMPNGNVAMWNALMTNFSGVSITTDIVGSSTTNELIGIDNFCYTGGNCCVPTTTSAFTIQTACNNGSFSVTATPVSPSPNHWWGLMETSVEGSITDANTVDANPATPAIDPVQVQTGGTASYPWIDLSKFYYISHRVYDERCRMWLETRIPIPLNHDQVSNMFNFKDAAGTPKTEFCWSEDVYLDGSASTGENGYYIDVWRRQNSSQPFTWYGQLGWFSGQVSTVNLSQLFGGQNPPVTFVPGYEYSVKLALANLPNCVPWTELQHTFKIKCCDSLVNGCFAFDLLDNGNGYAIVVKNFNTYATYGATHEWYVLSSPNQNGGPYTPVSSVTSTTQAQVTVYPNAQDGLFYTIVHRLKTPCGEICMKRVAYENGFGRQTAEPQDHCTPINCCFVFDYWPNGPGTSIPFTAEFNLGSTPLPGNQYQINTFPTYTYGNNSAVTHEWYLFSSPNADGGPYLPIEHKYGLNYSYQPASKNLYYFVIHKINGPCGSACYGQSICINCRGEKDCELCGPVDCSLLPVLWPYCVPPYLPHNDCEKGVMAWTDVPGAYSYDVEVVFNDPSCCHNLYEVSTATYNTTENFLDINTVPVPAYRCFKWRVLTRCWHGVPSTASEWICWDCPGKKEVKSSSGIMVKKLPEPVIAPNPNNGTMNVYLDVYGDLSVSVEVFDARGIRVLSQLPKTIPGGRFSTTLKLDGSRKGLYTIVFKTNFGVFSKKVIVN